jgi:hypothetical protein
MVTFFSATTAPAPRHRGQGGGLVCREKTLASGNLSGAAALAAGFGLCTGLAAVSLAFRTGLVLPDVDLGFGAEGGVHEIQPHIVSEIGAPLNPRASASASKTE